MAILEKDKLLIVDDDKNILKLLTILFSKTYDMQTALGGEEAISLVQNGFKPGVVICDQLMPNMDGVKVLNTLRPLLPNTICIILTGITSPKEIIKVVSDSKAFMFVKKPFNNLELLQAIKISFSQYKVQKRKSELSIIADKYKETISMLAEQISSVKDKSETNVSSLIKMLSNFAKMNEHFYFKEHITDVSQIAQHLTLQCHLSEASVKKVVYASLLHFCYSMGLPAKYKMMNLHTVQSKDIRAELIQHFRHYIYAIKQYDIIDEYTDIAIKIFEHADGTGLPSQLSGLDFTPEAQIVAMVNLYHDYVYKLPEEKIEELQEKGVVSQSKVETYERHKNCISFMHKNLKWFDHDIFINFQDLLKKRNLLALAFKTTDLKISLNSNSFTIFKEKDKKTSELYIELISEEKKHIIIQNEDGEELDEFVQIKIRTEDLKIGMKLTQGVSLKNSTLIFKKLSKVTPKILDKVKELYENDDIGEYIYIAEPEELV